MARQQSNTNQQPSQAGQSTGSLQTTNAGTGGVSRRSSSFPFTSQDMFTMHPFTLMRRMSEEMDRMFADALSGFPGSGSGRGGNWSPAIEVKQQGDQYIVCAELPGLKKEDVKVELQENALVIQGERKFENEENTGGVHRTERRYGQFYRAVPLPEGAEADKARARFENGMLEVSIPVAVQNPRREIPIETASGVANTGGQSALESNAGTSTTGNQAGAAAGG